MTRCGCITTSFPTGILDGQPVMRVTEKIVLSAENQPTRIKRRYDQARTPFDRLCETDVIPEEQKEQLRILRDQVKPRQLRLPQGYFT